MPRCRGPKPPRRRHRSWCSPAAIEKGAAAEPVFAAISRGTQWFGEAGNSQKMKLVLNAWLISMMQGIAESAQLAKTLGFTPTSCGAPWKAAAGGALCQSETGRHRQRAVYPADAAGACPERCPAGAFPGRAAHHAGAGKHRRTVAAGGGRGYAGEDLSAVYQWLSPSSKA